MGKLSLHTENNTLDRIYFIAGPPRVGKSILANTLAKKNGGHVVSTDSIRDAAKKACGDRESDYFIINRTENVSDTEWIRMHKETPEQIVENQNRESGAFWSSTVAFCNSFSEDSEKHIVEGVALLPELVASLQEQPRYIAYVGNTSEQHVDAMAQYAQEFPEQDWMAYLGYGREKIEAMASFVREMSEYFKREAERFGFPYYEIDDANFSTSIEEIAQKIEGTPK